MNNEHNILKNPKLEVNQGIDSLCNDVYQTIYAPLGKEISECESELHSLKTAYVLLKQLFWNIFKGNSREEYFTHLCETASIVLHDFPHPNIQKVILTILHDILENTEIDHRALIVIFGGNIAESIKHISKESIYAYIHQLPPEDLALYYEHMTGKYKNEVEMERIGNIYNKLRNIRDNAFLQQLSTLSDNEIDVKFAHRIHNLQTLKGYPISKINEKIVETQKFFIPIAKIRNPKAYEMMCEEIEKLNNYITKKETTNYQEKIKSIIEEKNTLSE